ncbi:MAG: diguanylate cyclase [Actinomycetota bacterium]|nr:diguanylate cyclase [Actinomycetota bacterium]
MSFLPTRFERYFGSFKFRLAAYFLLLALLPLFGAVWAFSEVAARGELGRTDARLNGALRVAVEDFASRVDQARQTATSLARATGFREALTSENRAALVRLYREVPNAGLYARGRLVAGSPRPPFAAERYAEVVDEHGRVLGRVVVSVPLNDKLVTQLRGEPGFAAHDRLALVLDGRTIAGPRDLARIRMPLERATDIDVFGERHRALATRLTFGSPEALLVVVTPKSVVEAQAAGLQRRMLLLAVGALAIAAGLAYALGRTIVRSLRELAGAARDIARGNFSSRVPVRGRDEFATLGRAFNDMASQLESRLEELAWERSRTSDAVARFGEALAATHNPLLLVPVIVESMVEATGAAGARLVVDGEELARAGDPDRGFDPLAIPLGNEDADAGVLLLTPKGSDFGDEARELAYWLASQARTALENASLHSRLQREALTDGLTELPNRRRLEEALSGELTRIRRYGGRFALIVADLDDFKQVNDRYGHLAGDDVLRAFADVLRANVRDLDTAARYGGEEFALLLPETDLAGAERVAERIREEMAARPIKTFPGAVLRVTVSFGVAAHPESRTQAELFSAADEALYRAKASGKNQVALATGSAVAVRPRA